MTQIDGGSLHLSCCSFSFSSKWFMCNVADIMKTFSWAFLPPKDTACSETTCRYWYRYRHWSALWKVIGSIVLDGCVHKIAGDNIFCRYTTLRSYFADNYFVKKIQESLQGRLSRLFQNVVWHLLSSTGAFCTLFKNLGRCWKWILCNSQLSLIWFWEFCCN